MSREIILVINIIMFVVNMIFFILNFGLFARPGDFDLEDAGKPDDPAPQRDCWEVEIMRPNGEMLARTMCGSPTFADAAFSARQLYQKEGSRVVSIRSAKPL